MLRSVTGTLPVARAGVYFVKAAFMPARLRLASRPDNGSYIYISNVLLRAFECRDLDKMDKRLMALEAQKDGN